MSKKQIKKISIKDVDALYNTFRDKMSQDEDMIEQLNTKLNDALARVGKLKKENSKLRNVVKVINSLSKNTIDEQEDDEQDDEQDEEDDEDDDEEEDKGDVKNGKYDYITMDSDSDDDETVL
jgi:hypothetical protein